MSNIRVSIITVSYNNQETITETIESILNQDYTNLEYIIIDGNSADNTVKIIQSYEKVFEEKGIIYRWISEPDKGISDAFNKGVKMSTGDYINFQGADDYLLSSDSISELFLGINKDEYGIVVGKIKRVKINGEILWSAPKKLKFMKTSLLFKMAIPHQGMFVSKKYFEKYGGFKSEFKYSMDYEHLLRSYKEFPKTLIKDVYISAWREGGIGQDNTLEVLKEYNRIKKRNKIAPIFILDLIYIVDLFKYYIKKI